MKKIIIYMMFLMLISASWAKDIGGAFGIGWDYALGAPSNAIQSGISLKMYPSNMISLQLLLGGYTYFPDEGDMQYWGLAGGRIMIPFVNKDQVIAKAGAGVMIYQYQQKTSGGLENKYDFGLEVPVMEIEYFLADFLSVSWKGGLSILFNDPGIAMIWQSNGFSALGITLWFQ